MTRREVFIKWVEGKLNEEEVKKLISEIPVPPLMDVDPLAESDSWYDGDIDNTTIGIYSLSREYGGEKVNEFLQKYWK